MSSRRCTSAAISRRTEPRTESRDLASRIGAGCCVHLAGKISRGVSGLGRPGYVVAPLHQRRYLAANRAANGVERSGVAYRRGLLRPPRWKDLSRSERTRSPWVCRRAAAPAPLSRGEPSRERSREIWRRVSARVVASISLDRKSVV